MERAKLVQALHEMLQEDVSEPIPDLVETASLRDDLGLDSLDRLTLLVQVQDRFQVVLDGQQLMNVITVRDFIDHLQTTLQTLPRAA